MVISFLTRSILQEEIYFLPSNSFLKRFNQHEKNKSIKVIHSKINPFSFFLPRMIASCMTVWLEQKLVFFYIVITMKYTKAVKMIEKLNFLQLRKVQENVGKVITYGTSPDLTAEP